MNWNELNDISQLEEMKELSKKKPVLIFKHSTRCGISSMALSRLERKWSGDEIEPYFLDLLRYREISSVIASDFGILHQSPQAILLKEGKPVYNSSHNGIDFDEIRSIVKEMESV
ncbi:MAG: bacillithiol system redox-active protein YtxJ [Cyclobacteriaceae bacterium]